MVDISGEEHPLSTEKEEGHGTKCRWHLPPLDSSQRQQEEERGKAFTLSSGVFVLDPKVCFPSKARGVAVGAGDRPTTELLLPGHNHNLLSSPPVSSPRGLLSTSGQPAEPSGEL